MKTADYGWSDGVPVSTSYLFPEILRLAKQAEAHSVLDAGCGNGTIAAALAGAGFMVSGVDGDVGAIALARMRCPAAHFEVQLFAEPPGRQYDFVYSTEVIEHLYAPHELAAYCYAALRPGGTLAISTPYHGYLKNLALAVAGKWDGHFTAHWHGGHIKFWSERTLRTLLEAAGFRTTEFIGVGRYPLLWKSMILVAHKPG